MEKVESRPVLRAEKAFSLVELSIVLVILGLLVGGVLSGQSLIRAAELRSVSAEYARSVTAIHSFRDKYFALPGDMTNAVTFWGKAAGTGTDWVCGDFESTDQKTCNGNGDGQIKETPAVKEEMRIWQHLANAGLIEGTYTGTYRPTPPQYVFGNNTPQSKISTATWWPYYWGKVTATVNEFAGNYGNVMEIGSIGSTAFILKPEEAWNIDTKNDDGLPGTGRVLAHKGTVANPCTNKANNVSDTSGVYNLSDTGKDCYLLFTNAF